MCVYVNPPIGEVGMDGYFLRWFEFQNFSCGEGGGGEERVLGFRVWALPIVCPPSPPFVQATLGVGSVNFSTFDLVVCFSSHSTVC